jgi:hypothetical protein
MKERISIAAVIGISMAGLVFGQSQPSVTDDLLIRPNAASSTDPFDRPAQASENPFQSGVPGVINFTIDPNASSPQAVELGRIMSELRNTEDSAKKAELTKKLESAVTKSFDADLKNREAELAKIEERIKKLRTQLDRRRAARSDIIQLQLKVLTNDAEGLGFSAGADFHAATPTATNLAPTAVYSLERHLYPSADVPSPPPQQP